MILISRLKFVLVCIFCIQWHFALSAEANLSPKDVLNEVYRNNAELASTQAQVQTENSLISKSYFLENPILGFMTESRGGEKMTSLSLTQEFMFPTKYFAMGSAQKARARSAQSRLQAKKLDLRQKTLSLYYSYASARRILMLLEAQRETLKEIARIAESRRATGAVPQQDEMKAHLEQTMIENEILMQKQDVVEMGAELAALLNREIDDESFITKDDLKIPQMKFSSVEIKKIPIEESQNVAIEKAMLEEAESERSLARQSYLPDFMFNYKKGEQDYSYEIGLSIPLWFFAKQNSEVAAASARHLEAEKRWTQEKLNTLAEVKSLSARTETFAKLLKIYESALTPQSMSALNSSRAAYTAGRVGFQELLDAERSLYSVRIEYYKNLAKYVDTVVRLEKVLGQSLSDLPFAGESL